MTTYIYKDELYHHGVKGQKWGVRRYQNEDGTYTQAGKERRRVEDVDTSGVEVLASTAQKNENAVKTSSIKKSKSEQKNEEKDADKKERRSVKELLSDPDVQKKIAIGAAIAVGTVIVAYGAKKLYDANGNSFIIGSREYEVGKKNVDTYLEANTSLYRIQSKDEFENFAFYATHTEHDKNEYAGLFGKNLTSRAHAEARKAEKDGTSNAGLLREKADNMKIYQLELKNTERLQVPSDENLNRIVGELVKDSDFHKNLDSSIKDIKTKMLRPKQQLLFNEALIAMKKDPTKLSKRDKSNIYKALNLSLTYHNDQQVAVQDKFYNALKKEGYSAILDINDKTYSSYHAHNPVIIFDTDKIQLQSVTKMDPKKIDELYSKYNNERIIKEIPENLVGVLSAYGDFGMNRVSDFVDDMTKKYVNGKSDKKKPKKRVKS